MSIQNTEFNWFNSTFTQTGKYCYGTILSENTIKDAESVEITNYVILVIDTNVVSGEIYDVYKSYSAMKRTAQFIDNQDGTWKVQLINYLISTKPAEYHKNVEAYPTPYVRPENRNKEQE